MTIEYKDAASIRRELIVANPKWYDHARGTTPSDIIAAIRQNPELEQLVAAGLGPKWQQASLRAEAAEKRIRDATASIVEYVGANGPCSLEEALARLFERFDDALVTAEQFAAQVEQWRPVVEELRARRAIDGWLREETWRVVSMMDGEPRAWVGIDQVASADTWPALCKELKLEGWT